MANGISLRAGQADQNVVKGAQQKALQEAQAAKRSAERLSKTTDAFTKNFQAGLQAGMLAKAAKKKEEEGYENTIKQNSDALLKSGYSLGEEYYNQAKSQVQDIRARYTAAKKEGNEDEADKILLELNLLSDTIANQKSGIQTNTEIINEYIEEGNLETNFSPKQKEIVSMFTESNAVLDKETNSFKYKNTNYDPNDKSKGPEFYTLEDFDKNVPITDNVTIEKYIKDEVSLVEEGMKFMRGEGDGFDMDLRTYQNEKLINENNIQGLMTNEDIFQGASFVDSLSNNPEIQQLLTGNFKDKNDDGKITWKDFAETEAEGLQKLKEAIVFTDNENYNFDLSKKLLANFMSLRQQSLFNKKLKIDPETNKPLLPNPGEREDDFVKRGGSVGYLLSLGAVIKDGIIVYDPSTTFKAIPGASASSQTTTKPPADSNIV